MTYLKGRLRFLMPPLLKKFTCFFVCLKNTTVNSPEIGLKFPPDMILFSGVLLQLKILHFAREIFRTRWQINSHLLFSTPVSLLEKIYKEKYYWKRKYRQIFHRKVIIGNAGYRKMKVRNLGTSENDMLES